VARIDVRGHAIGHGHAVGQGAVGFVRGDALHGVAHAITRVHARAVGVHDLLVPAEAQQVVAQRPFEVEAGGLALVVAAADAAVARVAAFRLGGGAEQAGELAVAGNDAAALVPRAAGQCTALVHAVHGLGHEVLGEVAGVGQRPVVAARAGGGLTGFRAELRRIPVVVVGGGDRIGLVGERQQLDQVVVVELPVELGAPEVVVAAGLPGLDGVDVLR